jgi:hypothetical protein
VEEIRRKNLEDNQNFLDQLRMTDVKEIFRDFVIDYLYFQIKIRNDFVNSARSIRRNKENTKKPIEYKK